MKKAHFKPRKYTEYSIPIAVVVIVVALGLASLLGSHAATPSVALEAESSTVASPATKITDALASGGQAVQFGSGTNGSCTPNPSITVGFPNNCNTGVPARATLTTNSSNTVSGTLTGVKLTGDISVSGSATITNSEIDGTIQNTGNGTLTLTDDTIIGNSNESFTDIFGQNITALRLNVSGGKAGLQCAGNCSTTDSWYHDPLIENAFHYDAIGANGVDGFVVRHNSISCTNHTNIAGYTGGCSADMGFFGDFAVITNVTVDNNLFVASNDSAGYCVITNASKPGKAFPTGSNMAYTNNVWQKGANGKCGQFGPVDNWVSGNGNVWTGNKWDDGTPLNE